MRQVSKYILGLLLTLSVMQSSAQIVGGRGNGQTSPQEVKPSELTKGAYTADVSLFTGGMSASYTLGSVGTPSGLSFTLSMSNSSTFTTGDNAPLLEGIPYGKNWSLNLPTISVSSEAYNKYSRSEEVTINSSYGDSHIYAISPDEARKQGQTFWFAPQISIPGVINERFIYKCKDADSSLIFVPTTFESYIEARFLIDHTWIVITEDGTVYKFGTATINVRNASNQRYNVRNSTVSPFAPSQVYHDVVVPEFEYLNWTVSEINHPNYPNNQRIVFNYEGYGLFDFYKEFRQQRVFQYLKTDDFRVYKDILLTSIESRQDFGQEYFEKLVLNYKTTKSSALGSSVLLPGQANVYRKDSLYNYTTVYAYGIDNGDSSAYDIGKKVGSANEYFTNWSRFHHVKSDAAQATSYNINHVIPNNPYVYSNTPLTADDGAGPDPINSTTKNYLWQKATTSTNSGNLEFDHCFLESPKIGTTLPSGDLYEIKALIQSGSSLKFCNYDINVVAGDQVSTSTPGNSISNLPFNEYQRNRNTTVFSTFNQAIKWNTNSTNGGDKVLTSNTFSLANLPAEFNGFRIQIGPANSDHNFARYGTAGVDMYYGAGNTAVPNSFQAYLNENVPGGLYSNDTCAAITPNFGIGLEWHMMRRLYSDMQDFNYNSASPRYKFWWNGNTGGATWANQPTAATDDVKLHAVELIRYSKNPYMLSSVEKFVMNGLETDSARGKSVLVSMIKLEYGVKHDTILNNDDPLYGTSSNTYNFNQKQYTYLLERIREIPVNASINNSPVTGLDTNKVLTTHFEYSKLKRAYLLTSNGTVTDTIRGNTRAYAISKITDRLGGVTEYEYYDYSITQSLISHQYTWKPMGAMITDGYYPNDIRMQKSYSLTYTSSVKKKVVTDRPNQPYPKEWEYSYSTKGTKVLTPSNLGDHFFVASVRTEAGYQTTIVKEPLVDANTNKIRTEYTHYISEQNGLLFGKLKQSLAYDAGNFLQEKKEYTYSSKHAFCNGRYRSDDGLSAEFYYIRKYYADAMGDYDKNGNTTFSALPTSQNLSTAIDFSGELNGDMPFLEKSVNLFPPNYIHSFFTPLKKEIITSYDNQLLTNTPVSIILGGNKGIVTPNPIIGSTRQLTSAISNNISLFGGNINISQKSMSTISEYEYWDADSVGITSSSGFKLLKGTSSPYQLIYEPSWKLYKKKTYSNQLPDAYSIEENFYFHDLRTWANETATTNDTLTNFDALNLTSAYRLRNLPYETRTTTKTQGQSPIKKSAYYWYDKRFTIVNPDDGSNTDTINYISVPPCSSGSGTGGNSSGTSGVYCSKPSGCLFSIPIVGKPQFPPSGYYWISVPSDSNSTIFCNWWCTSVISYQTRQQIFYNDNRDKLYLRSTKLQIDTLFVNPSNYTDPGNARITRFASSSNIYLPVYPYDTLLSYFVESRNNFGQVAVDRNERGLRTKYFYSNVQRIFFYDAAKPCNSKTVVLFPNAGLPDSISVGFDLSKRLTTAFNYNMDKSLDSLRDANHMYMHYKYDEYGRLKETYRNGILLAKNRYEYWKNNFSQTFTQRSYENFVETYTVLDNGSTVAEHSRAYVDPQGRKFDIMTQISPDYSDTSAYDTKMIHSGLTLYDNWNRITHQYKPFKYGDDPAPTFYTFIPSFNDTINDPRTEQQYENNQRSKVLRASKFGENINTGYAVNSSYRIITGQNLSAELGLTTAEKALMMPVGTVYQYAYLKTSAIDEDGKKVVTYSDAVGRQVATKTYIAYNKPAVTLFIYNSQGQQSKVINPEKQESTYGYNLLGNLYSKTTVDAGKVNYMYDVSGNIVLEQDANGRAGIDNNNTPYLRQYTYDVFNRLTKQERAETPADSLNPLYYQSFGLNNQSPSGGDKRLDFSCATSLSFAYNQENYVCGGPNCSWIREQYNTYISPFSTEKEFVYHDTINRSSLTYIDTQLKNYLSSHLQQKLKGRLSYNLSYNNDTANAKKVNLCIYSYTPEGFMDYEIHQFKKDGLAASGSLVSAIDYTDYNLRGSLKNMNVDVGLNGSTEYTMGYTYDGWNRLLTVSTTTGGNPNNKAKLAEYNYNDALGLVTKVNFYNSINSGLSNCSLLTDTVTYSYDVRDRLTKVNNTFFEEQLYYDNNIPNTGSSVKNVVATKNRNGNINATRVLYKNGVNAFGSAPVNGTTADLTMNDYTYYGYTYDGMNRLTRADASVMNVLTGVTSSSDAKLKYGDEILSYDRIGNILTLQRGKYYSPGTSNPANENNKWQYWYFSGTNKLDQIIYNNGNFFPIVSIYSYDANGSMRTDTLKKISQSAYGRANLPFNITANNKSLGYAYNANDSRIFKENITNNTQEYYLNDGAGRTLGIYDVGAASWTWYAYGIDKIAKFDASNNREMYITDHLGNTRVAYSNNITCTQGSVVYSIINEHDYYAYGSTLRSYVNSDREKYLFTGKERDNETELDYFEARYLDTDIGIFRQVDAFADAMPNWTPYRYAFCNPITFTDPSGNFESTHTDKDGNVIAVYDDGDNNIYKHDISKDDYKGEKLTSKNATIMGQTEFWDEFARHNPKGEILSGNGKGNYANPNAHINFDKSIDASIDLAHSYAKKAMDNSKIGLLKLKELSKNGGALDIKTKLGESEGYKYGNYYISGESAGNYLFGKNLNYARTLDVSNFISDKKDFWKLTAKEFGAYHNKQNKVNNPKVYPYYGEIQYSGRQVFKGYWGSSPIEKTWIYGDKK